MRRRGIERECGRNLMSRVAAVQERGVKRALERRRSHWARYETAGPELLRGRRPNLERR